MIFMKVLTSADAVLECQTQFW